MKAQGTKVLWIVGSICLTAGQASAGDVYELLPKDTQAVLTCNVKQLLAYDLFQKELPKIRENIRALPEGNFAMTTLGFDPLKDVEKVILATSNVDEEDELLVIVKGKFDLKKIKALAQTATKQNPSSFKIHDQRGQSVYEAWLPEADQPTFLAFADGQTLLVSLKRNYVTDGLDVHSGRKKSALKNPLAAVIRKVNPKHCITLAALGKGLTGTTTAATKVDEFYGGIHISDAVYLEFKVTTQDAGSAIRVAKDLQDGMKGASQMMKALADDPAETTLIKEVFDACKVSSFGTTVTITARISTDTIQKLIAKGD